MATIQDINAEIGRISAAKANIIGAIEQKGVSVPADAMIQDLPQKILDIPQPEPILEEVNVTPTTDAQTIVPQSPVDGFNRVNVSPVTHEIDSNIIPGNIKKDVSILGVIGTIEIPSPKVEKDINFWDWDGNLVDSWDISELQDKNGLPTQPIHDGFTNQGWNWTLQQLKAQNSKMNVGALSTTSNGECRLHIFIPDYAPMSQLLIRMRVKGHFTIDWGDGTIEEKNNLNQIFSHEYNQRGNYVIKIKRIDGNKIRLGFGAVEIFADSYSMKRLTTLEISDEFVAELNAFRNALLLHRVNFPNSDALTGVNAFNGCRSLTIFVGAPVENPNMSSVLYGDCIISLPPTITSLAKVFSQTTRAYFPDSITEILIQSCANCLFQSVILKQIRTIAQQGFVFCTNLEYVDLGENLISVGRDAFNGCTSMLKYIFRAKIPPTLDTGVFTNNPSTCKIYVPYSEDHDIINSYKTAPIWLDYANQIYELDENGEIPND